MKKSILPLFALLVVSPFLSYGQQYFQITAPAQAGENPYYVLPKACLVFEVPVNSKTYIASANMVRNFSDAELLILKGKYGLDSAIYRKLNGDPPYTDHSVVNDSIKITVLAKADLSKIFYTDGRKRWNKEKSLSFTYGMDGMVTDGESSSVDKTFDIVVKTLSGIVQVAGAAFKGADPTKQAKLASDRVTYKELDDILKEIDGLKDGVSDFDIYKDSKARLEKKYTQFFNAFFYTEKSKLKTFKIYYTPAARTITTEEIVKPFGFNTANGVLSLSSSLGDQLWASELTRGILTDETCFALTFSKPLDGLEKMIQANPNSNGFAYNIPAKLEIKFSVPSGKVIYNDFVKIPQFGTVGRITSEKNKLSFSLDPLTGELKKLGLGSSAVTVDQIGTGTAALTELLKYQDAKLDLEIKRLEAEKKKRDLLKEQ